MVAVPSTTTIVATTDTRETCYVVELQAMGSGHETVELQAMDTEKEKCTFLFSLDLLHSHMACCTVT